MPETGNNISFDTAKTVLVPVELYEKGREEELLRLNGMALAHNEVAIASVPGGAVTGGAVTSVPGGADGGIVAVMGVPADAWNNYKREYERGEVTVTSPLLCVAEGSAGPNGKRRKREVNILLTDENTYLAVWDKKEGGLRMAEVLPDTSTDSLLYYMQVLGRSFKLRKFDINIGGQRAGVAADTLRRYFPNVTIASFGI